MKVNGLIYLCVSAPIALMPNLTQASMAWFGLETPIAVADPHRAVVNVAEAKLTPVTIPNGEERYRELRNAAWSGMDST